MGHSYSSSIPCVCTIYHCGTLLGGYVNTSVSVQMQITLPEIDGFLASRQHAQHCRRLHIPTPCNASSVVRQQPDYSARYTAHHQQQPRSLHIHRSAHSPKWFGSKKFAIPSLIAYSCPQFSHSNFPSVTCVSSSNVCRSFNTFSSVSKSLPSGFVQGTVVNPSCFDNHRLSAWGCPEALLGKRG